MIDLDALLSSEPDPIGTVVESGNDVHQFAQGRLLKKVNDSGRDYFVFEDEDGYRGLFHKGENWNSPVRMEIGDLYTCRSYYGLRRGNNEHGDTMGTCYQVAAGIVPESELEKIEYRG